MTQIDEINSTQLRKALLPREKGWDEGSSPTLKFARQLRRNQTNAEKLLWPKLRSRALSSCKFRRQVPVGNYIADFFCQEAMLIVELDGGRHAEQQQFDQRRTSWLESQGFRLLRFWNNDVLTNIDGVCDVVTATVGNQNSEAQK